MLESLVIAHSTSGELEGLDFNSSNWLRWNTCVRQIAIGFGNHDQEVRKETTFVGPQAYGFFLEVVSGLHSPLVGETEVMGQFRELVENSNQITLKNKPQFLDFFRSILTDAKRVRALALKDLGSRSYGSLLRKYLRERSSVSILGAGKIVGEILPWLKPVSQVTVKCRRLEQAEKLKEKFNFIQVESIDSPMLGDTLVIAAPMKSEEIILLIKNQSPIKNIIDLRESSTRDPLNVSLPTVTLSKLFSEIENTEKDVKQKVEKARSLIKEMSQKWTVKAENRPFGWEDLCG